MHVASCVVNRRVHVTALLSNIVMHGAMAAFGVDYEYTCSGITNVTVYDGLDQQLGHSMCVSARNVCLCNVLIDDLQQSGHTN